MEKPKDGQSFGVTEGIPDLKVPAIDAEFRVMYLLQQVQQVASSSGIALSDDEAQLIQALQEKATAHRIASGAPEPLHQQGSTGSEAKEAIELDPSKPAEDQLHWLGTADPAGLVRSTPVQPSCGT